MTSPERTSAETDVEQIERSRNAVLYLRNVQALHIFEILVQSGEDGLTIKELIRLSGLGSAPVRRHLQSLEHHDLVSRSTVGLKKLRRAIIRVADSANAAIGKDVLQARKQPDAPVPPRKKTARDKAREYWEENEKFIVGNTVQQERTAAESREKAI